MRSKKGFVGDMLLYPIIIFAVILAIITLYLAFKTANDDIQATDIDSSFKDPINEFVTRYTGIWDFFALFMVLGFLLVMIISAFLIRTHPVFVGFTMFLWVIITLISVHLANAYHDVTRSKGYVDIIGSFTIADYLGQKLPHIALLGGALFMIVLYAKGRRAQVI